MNSKSIEYFSNGIFSFANSITEDELEAQIIVPTIDESAKERATAWMNGFRIGLENRLTGIGYGAYPVVEPVLTAPHSMALLRFATTGFLGLVSFLTLAAYAPIRLLIMIWNRDDDIFTATCLASVAAFMFKATVFGATFSVSSNIVWGFGVAMLLAASLTKEPCQSRSN